ncbi:hypothetical protein [Neorhizobium sp. LjRoot104]|uniref:hypothetical protein n=1 Tax=Neorhizobium sp. LjRoot104 TaxID=3342254 RepID=UPI003ECEDE1D
MSDASTFNALVELADRYCGPIGVGKDLIISLFEEQSDWAFIIQIDALNETACRDIISRLLSLGGLEPAKEEDISSFVSGMSYQGRTSVIRLLKMTGIPPEHTDFVDTVRTVRNTFAHDIRSVSRSLMDIIGERNDKSRVLKILSYIEQYDEEAVAEMFAKDPALLRFVILQQCLTFLYLIHINLRDREEGAEMAGVD